MLSAYFTGLLMGVHKFDSGSFFVQEGQTGSRSSCSVSGLSTKLVDAVQSRCSLIEP